jgi:hypothetical protein
VASARGSVLESGGQHSISKTNVCETHLLRPVNGARLAMAVSLKKGYRLYPLVARKRHDGWPASAERSPTRYPTLSQHHPVVSRTGTTVRLKRALSKMHRV